MATAEAADIGEWSARIGSVAAEARVTQRRFARWVPALAIVAGVLAAAAIALGAVAIWQAVQGDSASADKTFSWMFLSIGLAVISGAVLALVSTSARNWSYRVEAAALWLLRAQDAQLSAYEVGRHLGTVEEFDQWAAGRGIGTSETAQRPWTTEWTPDLVRPIRRGAAAGDWITAARFIFSGALFVAFIVLLAYWMSHYEKLGSGPWFWWYLAPFLIGLVAAAVPAIVGTNKANAEYRLGYATKRWNDPDVRVGVDLVHPGTGHILRPACSPALDLTTYRERLAAVRTAHPEATPTHLP